MKKPKPTTTAPASDNRPYCPFISGPCRQDCQFNPQGGPCLIYQLAMLGSIQLEGIARVGNEKAKEAVGYGQ